MADERLLHTVSKITALLHQAPMGALYSDPFPLPVTITGDRIRDSMLQELGDSFGPGADLKLLVNAADVGMHRFVANAQFFGDFFI